MERRGVGGLTHLPARGGGKWCVWCRSLLALARAQAQVQVEAAQVQVEAQVQV